MIGRVALFCAVVQGLGACSGEAAGARWQVVLDRLPGALLSVWGTGPEDVWLAGSDPGDGSGPLLIHGDASGWRRQPTGISGDLWWVHGFADGTVYVGGHGGQILRRRGGGAFEPMSTPGTLPVFGLWGDAPDDMWAVGGAVGGAGGAFVWRHDGSAWRALELPPAIVSSHALWKVFGRGPGDVWLVGTGGLVLHHDGQALRQVDSSTTRSLFTVHGTAERLAAVGGFGSGVILENDGNGWHDVTPPGIPQLVGVRLTEDGGCAVGSDGAVYQRLEAGWQREETGLALAESFHAVWVDGGGDVWAVGGQLGGPLVDGVLVYRGRDRRQEARYAE